MSEIISRHDFLKRLLVAPVGIPMLLRSGFGSAGIEGGKCFLKGNVVEKESGRTVPAKVVVVDDAGRFFHPDPFIPHRDLRPDLQKSYFYCLGEFQILLPAGSYKISACRGLAQWETLREVRLAPDQREEIRLEIPRLIDTKGMGWYSGNTHTHYHVKMEEDPDERLRVVPPAEDLDVSVISYLIRKKLPYITNKYPIGRAPEFSKLGTLVDVGQETRNNRNAWDTGYGHVLFMNIPKLIEPVSTGALTPDNLPDFPTLTMLSRRAKRLGGTTVWAHNGKGMECPVAVGLGAVDAFNVNDGGPSDYENYYRLLNCGFRLPLSTGTDWYIYDHNRVYVQLEGEFTYEKWLAGLKAGRTFATNGPLLQLTVDGKPPGETVQLKPGERRVLQVKASATSRVAFDRLEIVLGGENVAEVISPDRVRAEIEVEIPVTSSAWIAARVWSAAGTDFGYPVFAHTSPVYVQQGAKTWVKPNVADYWVKEIDRSIKYIRKNYQFASEADEAIARGLFVEAQSVYGKLSKDAS